MRKFEVRDVCCNKEEKSLHVFFSEVTSARTGAEKIHQKTIRVAGINRSTDVDALAEEVIDKCSILNPNFKHVVLDCLRQLQDSEVILQSAHTRSSSRMSLSSVSSVGEMNRTLRSNNNAVDKDYSIDMLESYIEMLYEDGDGVARGVAAVGSLAMMEDNLEVLVKNGALLSALVRLLSEDGVKNVRVAYGVLKFFHKLAEYSQFHIHLIEQKVGSTVMDFLDLLVSRYKPPRVDQDTNVKAESDGVRRSIEKILQVAFSMLDLLAEDTSVQAKMVRRGIILIVAGALRKFGIDGNGDKYWIRSALQLLHSFSVFKEAVSEMTNDCQILAKTVRPMEKDKKRQIRANGLGPLSVRPKSKHRPLHRKRRSPSKAQNGGSSVRSKKPKVVFDLLRLLPDKKVEPQIGEETEGKQKKKKETETEKEQKEKGRSTKKKSKRKKQKSRHDVVSCDILESLHVVLHHYCNDSALSEISLNLLLNLSFSTVARNQLVKLGFVEPLVKFLGIPALVPFALRLLYQLSMDEPNCSLLAKHPHLTRQLNKLLGAPSTHSEELISLCVNVTVDEDSSLPFVEKADQLYLIAVQTRDGLLIRFLRTVSQYVPLTLAKALAVDLHAIEPDSVDEYFFVELMGLAGNVSEKTSDKDLIAILFQLSKRLLTADVDSALALAAVVGLGSLAAAPEGAYVLSLNDCLQLLLDVIQRHQEEDEIVLQAVYAIYNLVRNVDVREQIAKSGAIEFLLDLATDTNTAIRRVCMETLDHLEAEEGSINFQEAFPDLHEQVACTQFEWHNANWLEMIKRNIATPIKEADVEDEGERIIYEMDETSFLASDS